MFEAQVILLWITVSLYAAGSTFYLTGLVFGRNRTISWVGILTYGALSAHTVALLLRWIQAGRGPYFSYYEVLTSDAWMAVVLFLLLRRRFPFLTMAGGFVLLTAFLMIGKGVLSSPELVSMPAAYTNYWLIVHVLFAKLAYASCLLSAALACSYLVKEYQLRSGKDENDRNGILQSLSKVEQLHYKLAGLGFMLLGVMIASGSIWAYQSWGSYWNWEPIETWSAVTWLVYGIHLHLRRTFVWRGRRFAWGSVISFGLVVFTYFTLTLFYTSVHENLRF